MASRRSKRSAARESKRDARSVVRDALTRLGVAFLDNDSDIEVADRLLRQLPVREEWIASVLEASVELMLPVIDVESRALLYRECYFLDATKIADSAVGRLALAAKLGTYETLGTDALVRVRSALDAAARSHVADPEYCVMPRASVEGPDFEQQQLAHEIAMLANLEDVSVRRILWRTWIDRLDYRSAAAVVGVPLETVERELIRLGLRAHDALGRGVQYRAWLDRRSPDGGRTHGGGDSNQGGSLQEGVQ